MMTSSKRLHCPICDTLFLPEASTAAMPFCSLRCKQIDAARWLDERYGLPIEEDVGEGDSELPQQGDKDIITE